MRGRRYNLDRLAWIGRKLEELASPIHTVEWTDTYGAIEPLADSIRPLQALGCPVEMIAFRLSCLGLPIEASTLAKYLWRVRRARLLRASGAPGAGDATTGEPSAAFSADLAPQEPVIDEEFEQWFRRGNA